MSEDKERYELILINHSDMMEIISSGPLLYDIPTRMSFDKIGRCFVWPVPYRMVVE